MIDHRRKNAIGVVRREPTAYDRAYESAIDGLDRVLTRARSLTPKQQHQLIGELIAHLEQREADIDEQERAS